jgi:hypothetical protein
MIRQRRSEQLHRRGLEQMLLEGFRHSVRKSVRFGQHQRMTTAFRLFI